MDSKIFDSAIVSNKKIEKEKSNQKETEFIEKLLWIKYPQFKAYWNQLLNL